MNSKKTLLALDVGERRIGIALADPSVRIAVAYDTIEVDGSELEQIAQLVLSEQVGLIVVGYPRNQSGEPTAQTAYVERFAAQLMDIVPRLAFQDESLTSVKAEEYLRGQGAPYNRAAIDAVAASIILQDYLETHYD